MQMVTAELVCKMLTTCKVNQFLTLKSFQKVVEAFHLFDLRVWSSCMTRGLPTPCFSFLSPAEMKLNGESKGQGLKTLCSDI